MTKYELLKSLMTPRQMERLRCVRDKLEEDPEFLDRKETPVSTVSVPSCYNEGPNTISVHDESK